MPGTTCPACGGRGGTDKVPYEYELDEKGSPVPVERRTYSPCHTCGGSGKLV